MRPDDVNRRWHSVEDIQASPRLSESDAAWVRRGESLGEMLLTSRKYAGVGWATMLVLAGGSLIMLALLGPPERTETAVNSPISTVSASSD